MADMRAVTSAPQESSGVPAAAAGQAGPRAHIS